MTEEVFVALFFIVALLGFFFWHRVKQFFRWLKGSRKTYYLGQDGLLVACSPKKLRTPIDRVGTNMKPSNQGVIEISHGWFRRPSAIYGDYHVALWKISKYWRWVGGDGRDCVSLTDNHGLRVETALQMINTYPSLQAMLDRIAELERKFKESELEKSEWAAGMEALRRRIIDNKQRFRSPAAKEIRDNIEEAFREMPTIKIDEYTVEKWLACFEGRVIPEEHPCDR